MRDSIPLGGIGLRAPDTRYPEAESLQDADTMNEGSGVAWAFVFLGMFAIFGLAGCGVIAFVAWFVVKAIESFV